MSRLNRLVFLCAGLLASAPAGARAQTATAVPTNQPAGAVTNAAPRTFQVKGVIKELKPDGKTALIAHEAIPDYMGAMTMEFEVRDTNELRGLRAGDTVTFRMLVTDKEGWIDHVAKSGTVLVTDASTRPLVHVVRDVPRLKEGDELPDYHFTNELGKVVSTAQLKGRAFAFTFFFTRCPYPTFCPFLSNSFQEAQKKLLAMTNGPTNWTLLSISFDTENDSPAALKDYAARYNYDPAHWSFLTGDLSDITAIGDQVGEVFGRDPSGGINHNLRTVVVDTQGRITSIIIGNTWTVDELVEEIVKAAKK
jgi:protein SCO1/2